MSDKVEDLIELLKEHIGCQNGSLDDIKGCQREHGETLARIDERTQQHEKRMNRLDKRTAGLGAVTGAVGGAVAVFVKALFGPPGA